jgi:fatty-acyl-CoA synthase
MLARFKVPDRFVAVDGLPKTSTGKIKKFELRAQAWQGHDRTIA